MKSAKNQDVKKVGIEAFHAAHEKAGLLVYVPYGHQTNLPAFSKFLNDQLNKLKTSDHINDFLSTSKIHCDVKGRPEDTIFAGIHYLAYATPEEFERIIKLANPNLIRDLCTEFEGKYSGKINNVYSLICQKQSMEIIKLFQNVVGPRNLIIYNPGLFTRDVEIIEKSLNANLTLTTEQRKEVLNEYKVMSNCIQHPKDTVKKNPEQFIQFIRDTFSQRSPKELMQDELLQAKPIWTGIVQLAMEAAQDPYKNQLHFLQGYLARRLYENFEINNLKMSTHSPEFKELKNLQKQLEIPEEIKHLMERDKNTLNDIEKERITHVLKEFHASAATLSAKIEKQFTKLPTSKTAMDALIKKYKPDEQLTHERSQFKNNLMNEACFHWGKLTSINSISDDKMTGEVLDRMYRTPERFQSVDKYDPNSYKHSKGEIQLRAFRLAYKAASAQPECSNKQAATDFLFSIGFSLDDKPEERLHAIKNLIVTAIQEENIPDKSKYIEVKKNLHLLINHLQDKNSTLETFHNFLKSHPQYLQTKKNLSSFSHHSKILKELLNEIEKCVDSVHNNDTLLYHQKAKELKQSLPASFAQQPLPPPAQLGDQKDDTKHTPKPK